MNHRNAVKKLGIDGKHKRAILRNLSVSLLRNERLVTTITKGKELKKFVEKLITRSKVDSLHNRRMMHRDIKDTKILKKLFDDIGKRYQSRKGGYTRLFHLGQRKGDAAKTILIELMPEVITETAVAEKETPKTAGKGV